MTTTTPTRVVDGAVLPSAGTWEIDPGHADVSFTGRHFMVTKVRGRFTDVAGTVTVAEDPLASSVTATLQAASINTKEAQRDGHLKSADFFDVEKYPTITFKSKRVEQVDGQHVRLVGDLTIKDVTKAVAQNVEYAGQAKSPWGTVNAGFTAQTKISRKEWGLTWNMFLEAGGLLVSKEIRIEIEVELVRDQP